LVTGVQTCALPILRKDHNWSVRTQPFYIGFEPLELLIAKLPQAAGLKIKDVDQADEMDAILVKTIPARALGFDALQIPFTVKFTSIVAHIMLSGNIENVFGSAALKYFIKGVELLGLRQLGNVSCVDKER